MNKYNKTKKSNIAFLYFYIKPDDKTFRTKYRLIGLFLTVYSHILNIFVCDGSFIYQLIAKHNGVFSFEKITLYFVSPVSVTNSIITETVTRSEYDVTFSYKSYTSKFFIFP